MTPPYPPYRRWAVFFSVMMVLNAACLGLAAATGLPWFAVVNAACVVANAVRLGVNIGLCRVPAET